MIKKAIKIFLYVLLVFSLYLGFTFYLQYQDHLKRKSFTENLVDTASPTVTVLRDSIMIDYQNNKRTLHVYVPPEYYEDTITRYPVIYFMDGESAFNDIEFMGPEWQVDEVINEASENGEPTAIVIGINQAEDRDSEYVPFITKRYPNAHGASYAKWLTTDLKTWVDNNYRTRPEAASTTIGGISLSGMMAYYTLMTYPEIFGKALIQSPSMWVDHEKLINMNLTREQLNGKKIMITVGAKEGNNMINGAKSIYDKFKKLGLNENELRFEKIQGEGHWHLTWRKSFAFSYPWLMQ